MNVNKNEILINKDVINSIAEGFLRGRYMTSMNMLKEISLKNNFSKEDIELLAKDFFLPNNGLVEVYFENNKMQIKTLTPMEKADIDKVYDSTVKLIKAGILKVHVPLAMLDSIARKLLKDNYVIVNKELKKDFAIILLDKVVLSDNENKKKAGSILGSENKILRSKDLISALSRGHYTSAMDMIRDFAENQSYKPEYIEDLERVYRLPNHSAIEIYFIDNKMYVEERTVREQEIYEIQIERIDSLIKGEYESIDVLNQYTDLTKRYLNKKGVEISSERNNGVFTEFTIIPPYNNLLDNDEIETKTIVNEVKTNENLESEKEVEAEVKEISKKALEVNEHSFNLGKGNDSLFANNFDEERFKHKPKINLMERLQKNINKLDNINQSTETFEKNVLDANTSVKADNKENIKNDNVIKIEDNIIDNTKIDGIKNNTTDIKENSILEVKTESENNSDKETVNQKNNYNQDLNKLDNVNTEKTDLNVSDTDNKGLSLMDALKFEMQVASKKQEIKKTPEIIKEKQVELDSPDVVKKYDFNDEKDFSLLKTNAFWILQYIITKLNTKPEKFLEVNDIDNYSDVVSVMELLRHASNDNSQRSTVQSTRFGFMTFSQLSRSSLLKLAERKTTSRNAQNVANNLISKNIEYSKTLEYTSILELLLKSDDVKKSLQFGTKSIFNILDNEIKKGDNSVLDPIIKTFKQNTNYDINELVLSDNKSEGNSDNVDIF